MLKEQSEVYAKLIFAIRNVSKIQSLKKTHICRIVSAIFLAIADMQKFTKEYGCVKILN